MINILAHFSTKVNNKRRELLQLPPEQQKITQIVYFFYIYNENLHETFNEMFKIGTCTLDRFDDRLKEHTSKFSNKLSLIDISIIPNASQEKSFHSFMKKKFNNLIIDLETVDGNFTEIYHSNMQVYLLYLDYFNV
jgi:hypothetical protein